MQSEELSYWMAYYGMFPWGEERADLRVAIQSSLIANVNRGKNARAFSPEDFMPKFNQPSSEAGKPKHTVDELASKFALFATQHNAAIAKKKELGLDGNG